MDLEILCDIEMNQRGGERLGMGLLRDNHTMKLEDAPEILPAHVQKHHSIFW